MELSSHEGEIPIPINSSYGGGHGHMIHHDHQTAATHNHNIIPTNSTNPQMPSINNSSNGVPTPIPISSAALELGDQNHNIIVPFKRAVRYRECLKNHAAAMGGNATDGCGEFMPSGEEGTLEALTCSACSCHRNFHRKEVEGESNSSPCDNYFHTASRISGRKVIVGHHHHKNVFGYPAAAAGTLITPRGAPPPPPPPPPHPHHMIMSYNMGSFASESDEQEDGGGGGGGVVLRPVPHQMVKKRFRTKFTQEQKEKMLDFAEKVGWKIQKQEESVVQQFCQEIGVRRRVLKVWMHNNKHNLAKKNPSSSSGNVQNLI